MTPYYVLVEEWNYPTQSGREARPETYNEDERDKALEKCLSIAEEEVENFEQHVMEDALPAEKTESGAIVTTRMGLDGFYFAVRLVKLTPLNRGGKI